MPNNSIQILQAAEAFSTQLQIRNALLKEQEHTEQRHKRITVELRDANDQLDKLRKALITVSGGAQ